MVIRDRTADELPLGDHDRAPYDKASPMVEGGVGADVEPTARLAGGEGEQPRPGSDIEGPKAQVAVAGCRHYRRQPDVPDVVRRRAAGIRCDSRTNARTCERLTDGTAQALRAIDPLLCASWSRMPSVPGTTPLCRSRSSCWAARWSCCCRSRSCIAERWPTTPRPSSRT